MSIWESVVAFLLCCWVAVALIFAFDSKDRAKSTKDQNKIMQQQLEVLQRIEQKLDAIH